MTSVDAALHAHLAVGVAFTEAIAQALELGRDLLGDGRRDDAPFLRGSRATGGEDEQQQAHYCSKHDAP